MPFLSGFAVDNLLQPKLALILELCRQGWSAHAGTMPPAVLKPGAKKKVFWRDTSKSKFYFIAMLESAHIFSSMDAALVAKANKVIKHNMPHSYYIGLVKLVGAELKTLVDLESTSEADFHKLVANKISCDDGENDDDKYAVPVPIAVVTDASELDVIMQQVLGAWCDTHDTHRTCCRGCIPYSCRHDSACCASNPPNLHCWQRAWQRTWWQRAWCRAKILHQSPF